MNNNKPVLITVGVVAALFTASLVFRYAMFSAAGLPGGWALYMGLPTGGIIVVMLWLIRLGIINFGAKSSPATYAAPATQRLQELDTLRANGAISDTEYAAERTRIISSLGPAQPI